MYKRQDLIIENECTPIPAEALPHVFEPFYRPDYARNREGGGNGLGLYLSLIHILVLLGKRITALLRRSGQGVIPDTMTFGEVTVAFSGYSAWDRDGKIELTPREIDLLRLFVAVSYTHLDVYKRRPHTEPA